MIWTKQQLTNGAEQGEVFFRNYHFLTRLLAVPKGNVFRIAIVGGGPKGCYALDHLMETIRSEKIHDRVLVFWFNNTTDFASGPNYRIQQPDYLLMNYNIGHIDAWYRQYKYPSVRPDLLSWISQFNDTPHRVRSTDYASRALVGRYLQDSARRIILDSPENVEVILVKAKVADLNYNGEFSVWIDDQQQLVTFDNVLLTTGHCYRNVAPFRSTGARFEERYIPHAYSFKQLTAIPAGDPTGVAGMGLTCIDVILQLTEGRGGQWLSNGAYRPSGNEPVIYPFSRSNLPIVPRASVDRHACYQPHFMNESWFGKMRRILDLRKIDFKQEVYPMLRQEVAFAFYSTLWQTRDEAEIDQRLGNIALPDRFTLEKLLRPEIPRNSGWHEHVLSYLREYTGEAEKGELNSPLIAAGAVWREITPMLSDLYRMGGFTGDSQAFLDACFSAFCRVSYGPPAENVKKIIALAEAGIVQFRFSSDVQVRAENSQFVLRSATHRLPVGHLIDARIARPSLEDENSPFYARLLARKIIMPFENERYRPGCAAIGRDGKVISRIPDLALFFYGSNTEGVFLDNDTLSRTKNDLGCCWAKQVVKQVHKQTDQRTASEHE